MKIIIDKEVDLNKNDLLQTKVYADTLKGLILGAPKAEALTIGLFGAWGSDKSSIIKTLKADLNDPEQQEGSRTKFIIYDAWKYANDAFRRTFILTIQNELKVKSTSAMRNFYSSSSTEKKVRFKFNFPFLFLIVITLLLGVYSYDLLQGTEAGNHTLPVIVTLLSYFAVVFSKTFIELKESVQTPVLSAPEQFEECFNELIRTALSDPKPSWFQEIFCYKKQKAEFDKIIIVIDNIDRCSKEVAYELLTNTKNFINSKLEVTFLIPVDEKALKAHFFKVNEKEKSDNQQSEEFLRKYFNVIVRLKNFRNTEIFDFSSAINDKMQIGLGHDTVNIIAREYASNPRRIIQFYNNLSVELEMMTTRYGEEFTKNNEAAICKFLIIREEWPDKYQEICDHPQDYLRLDRTTILKPNRPLLSSYEVFLDSTYVSTRNISLKVLQKILMNSNNYDETLPGNVHRSLSSGMERDIRNVLSGANLTHRMVLNHLLFNLNTAVANELFETDVSSSIHDFFGFILAYPETDRSYLNRLEQICGQRWNDIIPKSRSFERLMKFNEYAISKDSELLDKGIVGYITFKFSDNNVDKSESDFELYKSYVYHSNEQKVALIANSFRSYLKSNDVKEKIDLKITEGKLDILYNGGILDEFFVDTRMLLWNDPNYDHWLYFLKHLKDPTFILASLLGNAGRSLEQRVEGGIEAYILKFLPLLSSIPSVSYNAANVEQLHRINDFIFMKPSPRQQNFMERSQPEFRLQILDYLLHSYRITFGSESTAGWIKELLRISSFIPFVNILKDFIVKYKGQIDFKCLKFLANVIELIDKEFNGFLFEFLYLKYKEEMLFSEQEIIPIFVKFVSDSKAYPEYELFLKIHYGNTRGRLIIESLLFNMPKTAFRELPRGVRTLGKNKISVKASMDVIPPKKA